MRIRWLEAIAGMLALAWIGWAGWGLARAAPRDLVANALAGDIIQSGAAMSLLALPLVALARRRGELARATTMGTLVVAALLLSTLAASIWMGMPWAGFEGRPSIAAMIPGALILGAAGLWAQQRWARLGAAYLLVITVLAHGLRLVQWGLGADDLDVALVSYAIPAVLACSPAILILIREQGPTSNAHP